LALSDRVMTMSRASWLPLAALAGAALVLFGLGASKHWDDRASNILFFAAWCAALVLLFIMGLRLPLRIPGPRYRAMLFNAALAIGATLLSGLANVAMWRHDVHLDLSREAANTPPPQFASVVDELQTDISLTYFYNSADANALKAKDLLTIASRANRHIHFRAVDLDKEPALAREFGIRAYNSAVLQAEGRRAVVENSADLAQMAYAALRVLKQQVEVLCFVTGHGESVPAGQPHFHYSHVETLQGHEVQGAGDILEGEPDGLDRMQLALTALGYSVRSIEPARLSAIPADCRVVAEIGPRGAYAPRETSLLSEYLGHGGRLLVMIDPSFSLGAELGALLGKVGLTSEAATVIDPVNHYGPDDDKVAVPYYPPHPITRRLALTIFPNARPIRVGVLPAGITSSVLAASSNDSYLRPPAQGSLGQLGPAAEPAGANLAPHGPAILAVALEGRWPDAPAADDNRFRLVLVGDTNFAANSYFPYVSNGDLSINMVRWLADDDARPAVKPQSFSLEQITLTRTQMRDIFLMLELVLPMSVVLFGGIVWWRRR
jgi:hypothetical protein